MGITGSNRGGRNWTSGSIIVALHVVALMWMEYGPDNAIRMILFGSLGMVVAGGYLYGLSAYRRRRRKLPHEEETQQINERTG